MQRRAGFALTLGVVLMSGLQGSARPAPPEGFLQSFTLRAEDPDFGGLSAVEVIDASHILVMTDKGRLCDIDLQRDAEGEIEAAAAGKLLSLRGKSGKVLAGKLNDSEGMDLAPDGSLIVSFEGKPARLARYAHRDGPADPLPTDPAFAKFPRNAAFEAMARDANGTVFAIPEGLADKPKRLPVFRLIDGRWDQSLSLPWDKDFLPVAADFGPDGRLYLLERRYIPPLAFASRLRRFDVAEAGLGGETVLFETQPGVHDNLEGLSIWRDPAGGLRATMVSDNNFQWFLRSDLVEYRLPD